MAGAVLGRLTRRLQKAYTTRRPRATRQPREDQPIDAVTLGATLVKRPAKANEALPTIQP